MKNKLIKILTLVLAIVMVMSILPACGGSMNNVTLLTPGAVVNNSNGGFMIETENYVYYINGQADSSADNSYGKPIKGALMVSSKADLTKAEVVIPKLMVASDYSSGIYLYGDTLYYATPSTKTDTTGGTLSTYVDFCSAKIDGTNVKTYLSTSGSDIQYRIVESAGTVYFVYFDSVDRNIYSFNTATNEKHTVCENPNEYFFVSGDAQNTTPVIYTTLTKKPYGNDYYQFTKLYAYMPATKESKLVLDGQSSTSGGASATDSKYVILKTENSYVYYSKTDLSTGSETPEYYAITITDLVNLTNGSIKLNSTAAEYLVDTAILVSPTEVYAIEVVESEGDGEGEGESTEAKEGSIIKDDMTTLIERNNKSVVAKGVASDLIKVTAEALYYTNADGNLIRYNRLLNRNEIVVEDTVLADWYELEFIGDLVFYVNTATEGSNYVNYIDATSTITEEDTDDDNVNDKFYIDKTKYQKSLGICAESDAIAIVSNMITTLGDISQIAFDTDNDGNIVVENGEPVCTDVDRIAVRYNALTDAQKGKIAEDTRKLFANYQEALRVSRLLYKLFGFDDVTNNKESFRPAYDIAKAEVDKLLQDKANGNQDATKVVSLLVQNGRWYLQECQKYFEA